MWCIVVLPCHILTMLSPFGCRQAAWKTDQTLEKQTQILMNKIYFSPCKVKAKTDLHTILNWHDIFMNDHIMGKKPPRVFTLTRKVKTLTVSTVLFLWVVTVVPNTWRITIKIKISQRLTGGEIMCIAVLLVYTHLTLCYDKDNQTSFAYNSSTDVRGILEAFIVLLSKCCQQIQTEKVGLFWTWRV